MYIHVHTRIYALHLLGIPINVSKCSSHMHPLLNTIDRSTTYVHSMSDIPTISREAIHYTMYMYVIIMLRQYTGNIQQYTAIYRQYTAIHSVGLEEISHRLQMWLQLTLDKTGREAQGQVEVKRPYATILQLRNASPNSLLIRELIDVRWK